MKRQKEYNRDQIPLALGDVNRFYFWQKNGRDGTDEELIRHWTSEGGAEWFASQHRSEYE